MSHTTKAALGTVFIHDGGYTGDVRVLPRGLSYPHAEVVVPFADLRELVFAYLRSRRIEWLEQAGDDELEARLRP